MSGHGQVQSLAEVQTKTAQKTIFLVVTFAIFYSNRQKSVAHGFVLQFYNFCIGEEVDSRETQAHCRAEPPSPRGTPKPSIFPRVVNVLYVGYFLIFKKL